MGENTQAVGQFFSGSDEETDRVSDFLDVDLKRLTGHLPRMGFTQSELNSFRAKPDFCRAFKIGARPKSRTPS